MLRYLENWLPCFYPERMDLFKEAELLVVALGGRLKVPRLSWKYAWIETLFSHRAAKQARLRYNEAKWSLLKAWAGRCLAWMNGTWVNQGIT